MDGLAVGDYMDCQKTDGPWDAALIEKFSEYRTEIEIVWTDGKQGFNEQPQCTVILNFLPR